MRKSTEQIFDAPWYPFSMACDFHGIKNSKGLELFSDASFMSDVKRLARLPELYDALLQATEDACRTCNHEKAEGILDRPCNDLHANECYVAEWRKLLKKVRDCK